jgi:polar amino acid transport system permease protein
MKATRAEGFSVLPLAAIHRCRVVANDSTIGGVPRVRLRAWHGLALLATLGLSACAAGGAGDTSIWWILATLWKWTPLLAQGFLWNLIMSVLAMAIGTTVGTLLGIAQVSRHRAVRMPAWFVTQFFRNAPWLVLMFFVMYLVPFQFKLGGWTIPFPDWIKATLGFSLPIMANVSELVRGAVQSIPSGQQEAARSLGFTRRQTFWLILIPQCVKRVLPPWMNLYAILIQATVLASIVGVGEMVSFSQQVIEAEHRTVLLMPVYSYVLIWFFAYCYPIARLTERLERRFAVHA